MCADAGRAGRQSGLSRGERAAVGAGSVCHRAGWRALTDVCSGCRPPGQESHDTQQVRATNPHSHIYMIPLCLHKQQKDKQKKNVSITTKNWF